MVHRDNENENNISKDQAKQLKRVTEQLINSEQIVFRIRLEVFELERQTIEKTSLLRRLQEQTLPDDAQPMGKIHPFSKIAVTFEPVMRFGCPLRFRISKKN